MPHIYEHVFEQFRIVDPDDSDRSIVDDFAGRSQWLEQPGCLFQRNNVVLGSRIRTEGVIKAGLFVSVILKGAGSGRARKGAKTISYSDASMVVMAFREPTLWDGDAPRGAHMQAAGVAFPVSSLERLGLMDEFIGLFDSQKRNVFVASLKASPRIKAIAMEMISPVAAGRAADLLLSAHAMEILARTMLTLRGNEGLGLVSDQKRLRLGAVVELIQSDLRHPWTIAELARHAGVSRRSFTAQFHRLYGVSASEYLRTSRLKSAREALLHQGLSVTEAAYAVGYGNPANFSTAFRRHFGYVPSSCQRDGVS
ncbi:AraC family transcriptional regulator [Bradyrhizobium sp. LjRoot220]|uniref:helix-turn-helix transcriptional regulator n=1 Tax=Bradyrhizobium sp. LjRoot220 TaxID=3342284 RepID=UPI003ED062A5